MRFLFLNHHTTVVSSRYLHLRGYELVERVIEPLMTSVLVQVRQISCSFCLSFSERLFQLSFYNLWLSSLIVFTLSSNVLLCGMNSSTNNTFIMESVQLITLALGTYLRHINKCIDTKSFIAMISNCNATTIYSPSNCIACDTVFCAWIWRWKPWCIQVAVLQKDDAIHVDIAYIFCLEKCQCGAVVFRHQS